MDLSAPLGVSKAGHLPPVAVLGSLLCFSYTFLILPAQTSMCPDTAFVGHPRFSAPPGLLQPPRGLAPQPSRPSDVPAEPVSTAEH